ncbi:DNA-processing protein DprA [bacterium]|nr:DNA-processing protein DprA [bacterium]
MNDEQRRRWWWALISSSDGWSASDGRKLQNFLEHNDLEIEDFWKNLPESGRWCGLKAEKVTALLKQKREWTLETWVEYLAERQIKVVLLSDDNYPPLLRYIPDWTPVLFYQGKLDCLQRVTLAVVGARKMTAYGQTAIEMLLGRELAGVTVVSGLMTGVDETAHRRALETGCQTAAFLGYGLEIVWPATMRQLKEEILLAGGAVVSEMAPWAEPRAHTFPIRNRLVAGVSVATLVIEAAKRSGSLITSNLALDYGREVMVVPGPINSELSVGCLELIKKGALPVASGQEVREVLMNSSLGKITHEEWQLPEVEEVKKQTDLPGLAGEIAKILEQECLESEELCQRLGREEQVLQELGKLEIMGQVVRGETGRWRWVR